MIDIGGGFAITERHEWGARQARSRSIYRLSDHGGKTAHYSTGEELGVEDTAQWTRNIQGFHMDDRGWDDVGYHFLYDRFGNIYEGRPLLTVGAHAGHSTGNRTAGCCFLGDDDPGQDVPDIARSALAHLSVHIDRQTREGPWFGHRDWKNTPCPGDEIYAFLPRLHDYLKGDSMDPIKWAADRFNQMVERSDVSEGTHARNVDRQELAWILGEFGVLDLTPEHVEFLREVKRYVDGQDSGPAFARESIKHLRDHPHTGEAGPHDHDGRYVQRGTTIRLG